MDVPDGGLTDSTSLNSVLVNGYGSSINISRPGSVQSMRARADAGSGNSRPSLKSSMPKGYAKRSGRPVSFIAPVHGEARWYRPTFKNRLMLCISQLISFIVSSLFLITVVGWAMLAELAAHLPRFLRRVSPVEPVSFPWDNPKYMSEKCVKDVRYYAREAGEGYDIIDEEVETEDGFYLRCVHP